MEDDLGEETENPSVDGDLNFTVAPLSFRTGPQIEQLDESSDESSVATLE